MMYPQSNKEEAEKKQKKRIFSCRPPHWNDRITYVAGN